MSDLKDTAVDNDDLMSDLDDDIDLLVIDDLEIDNLQETEPEFIRSAKYLVIYETLVSFHVFQKKKS